MRYFISSNAIFRCQLGDGNRCRAWSFCRYRAWSFCSPGQQIGPEKGLDIRLGQTRKNSLGGWAISPERSRAPAEFPCWHCPACAFLCSICSRDEHQLMLRLKEKVRRAMTT